ncbi:M15 family metallopeptidase [Bacillus sp. SM-B1]|uniref:M15 family metallopeptidase n=1 Tax=Bacillus sp. SM-B1 TaxID=2980102 RepID=UPI002948F5CA|nr:M15 family metallopeptidase [Bacillus sp. SM-B1]MDV6038810.1 M15 family metallopeptidase [Bacillus sp. SM-B1]
MKYNKRNVDNLNKLADNTKAAAFKWYQYCVDNNIEVLIYETIRTVEQQRENVRKGASQTMRSYHLVGQALDFVPIKSNGTEDWNGYNKEPWASAVRYAKQIGFEWGGDWRGFVDSPHLQWNYKGYGTDTFGSGDYHVKAEEKPVWTNEKNPNDGSIGTVTLANAVNGYSQPDMKSEYYAKTFPGGTYKAYGSTGGFVGIGGGVYVPNDALEYKAYTAVVTPNGKVNMYRDARISDETFAGTVDASSTWKVLAYKDRMYAIGNNVWLPADAVMIV